MLKDSDLYRERKEASISDLTGTTMLELVLVSTPIPIGIWLLSELKVGCVSENFTYRRMNFTLKSFTYFIARE